MLVALRQFSLWHLGQIWYGHLRSVGHFYNLQFAWENAISFPATHPRQQQQNRPFTSTLGSSKAALTAVVIWKDHEQILIESAQHSFIQFRELLAPDFNEIHLYMGDPSAPTQGPSMHAVHGYFVNTRLNITVMKMTFGKADNNYLAESRWKIWSGWRNCWNVMPPRIHPVRSLSW